LNVTKNQAYFIQYVKVCLSSYTTTLHQLHRATKPQSTLRKIASVFALIELRPTRRTQKTIFKFDLYSFTVKDVTETSFKYIIKKQENYLLFLKVSYHIVKILHLVENKNNIKLFK